MKGVLLLLSVMCAVAFGKSWTRLDPHIVPDNTHIVKNDSHISFFHPDGSESHFLKEAIPNQRNVVHPNAKTQAVRVQDPQISGWVSSFWSWGTSYTYFSGSWVVPSNPTGPQSQVVFFFNSFEGRTSNGGSGADILQPVLQWNNGVSGWTLAAWYGYNGAYTEATPVACSAGQTITGVISLENGVWYTRGYINGVLKSTLSIAQSTFESGDAQNTAQWALEVYSIDTCNQFPPNNACTLSNIVLKDQGNTVTPSWGVPSTNTGACNAGGTLQSSSQITLTWQSGVSSCGGSSTSGCGSGLLYCPNAGGTGQCYSSSQYTCQCSSPYLCPNSAPHACNGGCQSASC